MKPFAKKANIYLYSLLDPVAIVAKILDKAFLGNNRIMLSCSDEIALYDSKLWHYEQISFLPHTTKNEERKNFPIFLSPVPLLSEGEEVLVSLQTTYDKEILESFKMLCEVASISESLANEIISKKYIFKDIMTLISKLQTEEDLLAAKLKQLLNWGWDIGIWLKTSKSAWHKIKLS